MAKGQIGMPDSITKELIPPHLRRKPKTNNAPITTRERVKILTGLKKDINYLRAYLGQALLNANRTDVFKSNTSMWRTGAYKMMNDEFDAVNWHSLKFNQEEMQGDIGYTWRTDENWYFKCGLKGRYLVTAEVLIEFVDVGVCSWQELSEAYGGGHVLTFDNELYQLAIYEEAGLSTNIIGSTQVRSSQFTDGNYNYFKSYPIQGTTFIYLDKGEEFDIRINLLQLFIPRNIETEISGSVKISYIDDKGETE